MPLLRLTDAAGACADIACESGQKLSEAIWLSGKVAPEPLCGGLGLCARCRVQFLTPAPEAGPAEKTRFSTAEIAAGWRLACRQSVTGDASLALPRPAILAQAPASSSTGGRAAFLGIDFGTTSVQWRVMEPETGKAAASGAFLNPQAGAGADVVSRLAFCREDNGLMRLSLLAREAIAGIVRQTAREGFAPKRACIAANSAMTEILLGVDVSGLAAAPYRLATAGNITVELELPGAAAPLATYIPPLPAPFVGGDVSAGLAALLERNIRRPFMLADLGTNAEFALFDGERLYLASAPLGPALEGIGPACGQLAGPGVITGFLAGPAGLLPQNAMPASETKGISATGYISLLAILLRTGAMTPEGHLSQMPATPLAARLLAGREEDRLWLPDGLFLDAADIELLLKVKAAFAVTIGRLLETARIAPADLGALWLAGALGQYIAPEDLVSLGFLPHSLLTKIRPCGNAALAGACLLAEKPETSEPLARLCANAQVLQMTEDPDFMEAYLTAMTWGHYGV